METIENIEKIFKSFSVEAEKAAAGNKSAGQRARKASLELIKLLKEFRKESLTW